MTRISLDMNQLRETFGQLTGGISSWPTDPHKQDVLADKLAAAWDEAEAAKQLNAGLRQSLKLSQAMNSVAEPPTPSPPGCTGCSCGEPTDSAPAPAPACCNMELSFQLGFPGSVRPLHYEDMDGFPLPCETPDWMWDVDTAPSRLLEIYEQKWGWHSLRSPRILQEGT